MSIVRKTASRINGAKSFGPTTAKGKSISSKNAQKHGILSRELILPGEDEREFRELFDQLQIDLRPLGTLENTLVERIAIAIWRQRRIVRAETAQTQIRQMLKQDTGNTGGVILNVITGVPPRDKDCDCEDESEIESKPVVSTPKSEDLEMDRLKDESRLFPTDADQMSRYQSALDNQLYKAMRALREAQAWRLKTIDSVQD